MILSRTRHLPAFIVVVAVTLVHVVIAYRPSTHISAPTSLSYSGVAVTSTASDTAVANLMRKRYGSSTIDSNIPLANIYASPTVSITESLKGTTTEEAVQLQRQKWGVDHQYANEYWFDKRIHTLGNHGFWGALHAAMAPISTKVIDMAAYDGIDIRKVVSGPRKLKSICYGIKW